MRPDAFMTLVEEAKTLDANLPDPLGSPAEVLFEAKRARRRRAALVAGLTAVVVLLGGSLVAFTLQGRDPAPVAPTPPDTQQVGAGRFALTVPADWELELAQGTTCPATAPRTVRLYLLSLVSPLETCGPPSDSTPQGGAWPAWSSLSIYTNSHNQPMLAPEPSGSVGGQPYYISSADHRGDGVARQLVLPDTGITFVVGAENESDADAILKTIHPIPEGMTTIALVNEEPDGVRFSIGHGRLDDPRLPRDEYPVVVEAPPGSGTLTRIVEVDQGFGYEQPGQLLKVDPPVGAVVKAGTTVTLTFTAGDLFAFVDDSDLRAAGWVIGPPDSFMPPITRAQIWDLVKDEARDAFEQGGNGPRGKYPSGAFLRTLNGDPAWVVALKPKQSSSDVLLIAVDAETGAIVDADNFALANPTSIPCAECSPE